MFLTAWTRRKRFEDALDEEVRFHLEACTEELVRSGVPRREAARRARLQFGSIERAKDDCRQASGLRLADALDKMIANIRLGFRMLFRTPVVTCVAVVSLALGIGSNAAIFSLFNQVLLRPLPVVEPERLVNLVAPPPKPGSATAGPAGGYDEIFSYPMFRDLQRGQDVFADIAAHRNFNVHVVYDGRTIAGQGLQVSGSYFPVLGLAPAAGRLLGPESDAPIGGHAIGATRWHLVVQLLTESCLLAFLGGVVGLGVGQWTLSGLGLFLPSAVGRTMPSTMEPAVVFFAAAMSLATGILFGIYPALRTTRVELAESLKDDAGQPAGARAAIRFRDGLVMAQFALAMTLLVAAGLFIQSLRNVTRVDLGIRTENVVAFRLSPEFSGYTSPQTRALFERVEDRLAEQPGVTGVTAALIGLFTGNSRTSDVMVEGFEPESEVAPSTRYDAVAPGYFRTLGIPLLAGRTFAESDDHDAPRVAIVNEAFVRMLDLGRDVVGKRMGQGSRGTELDIEIIGVVADAGYDSVKNPGQPLHYLASRQRAGLGSLTFYVRTALPPDGFLRTIRALMAELDPNLPVTRLTTLPQQVRENVSGDRMISLLSLAFAGLATLLAAIGLYGVLACAVAQRTREFGLRMALGADAARLRAMVLGQVGRMTLAGGAIGLVAALGLARAAQSMLYEVDGLPPAVVAAAVLALAAVALAAGLVPAHRAARVDPMEALRHQ